MRSRQCAGVAQCDAVLGKLTISATAQPPERGLHCKRLHTPPRPRTAGPRRWNRRMGPSEGPLSCTAPQLLPTAAAGLATTALETGSQRACFHLLRTSIPWTGAKTFIGDREDPILVTAIKFPAGGGKSLGPTPTESGERAPRSNVQKNH